MANSNVVKDKVSTQEIPFWRLVTRFLMGMSVAFGGLCTSILTLTRSVPQFIPDTLWIPTTIFGAVCIIVGIMFANRL